MYTVYKFINFHMNTNTFTFNYNKKNKYTVYYFHLIIG